jgi:hypothetical protein
VPTQYSKEQGWIYSEDVHPLALVRVGVHGFGRVFFKQKCNIGPLEGGGAVSPSRKFYFSNFFSTIAPAGRLSDDVLWVVQ